MTNWYYVEGSEIVGPVAEDKLAELISSGMLNEESYIWKKGFDNWEKIKDVDEVQHMLEVNESDVLADLPPISNDGFPPVINNSEVKVKTFSFDSLGANDKVISIKIGIDRGVDETEYGPYTLTELKAAYNENRVNEKTLMYIPGMKEWIFIGDMPIFEKVFGEAPPVISDIDRRRNLRKPFVARMFFHDSKEVFEGVCRDISVGGMQILVSHSPFEVGDEIKLNVHPDNDAYNFVATGLVVRSLDADQGFALRFVDLSDEAERAINSYMKSDY